MASIYVAFKDRDMVPDKIFLRGIVINLNIAPLALFLIGTASLLYGFSTIQTSNPQGDAQKHINTDKYAARRTIDAVQKRLIANAVETIMKEQTKRGNAELPRDASALGMMYICAVDRDEARDYALMFFELFNSIPKFRAMGDVGHYKIPIKVYLKDESMSGLYFLRDEYNAGSTDDLRRIFDSAGIFTGILTRDDVFEKQPPGSAFTPVLVVARQRTYE
jgi:hypothetical protein